MVLDLTVNVMSVTYRLMVDVMFTVGYGCTQLGSGGFLIPSIVGGFCDG